MEDIVIPEETLAQLDTDIIDSGSVSNQIDEKRRYATGVCFQKLIWIFLIGCVIGTYYEQVLTWFQKGRWESRAGLVIGPFNPVYGGGFALVIFLLARRKRTWWKTILYGALIGGITEYAFSYLQELVTGGRSWNYQNKLLNINGRTTIPFAFFWGFGAFILVRFVYPPISKAIEHFPAKAGKLFSNFWVTFFCFNIILTGLALLRQSERRKGIPSDNFVAAFLDDFFDDDYLKKVYPNMDFNYAVNP